MCAELEKSVYETLRSATVIRKVQFIERNMKINALSRLFIRNDWCKPHALRFFAVFVVFLSSRHQHRQEWTNLVCIVAVRLGPWLPATWTDPIRACDWSWYFIFLGPPAPRSASSQLQKCHQPAPAPASPPALPTPPWSAPSVATTPPVSTTGCEPARAARDSSRELSRRTLNMSVWQTRAARWTNDGGTDVSSVGSRNV